jgi:DNA-binding LytR/AlgR family response regulator
MPLNKFKDIFRRAVNTIKLKENDFISIAYGGTTVKLELSKIIYFEVLNRLITVHTADSSIEYYGKMESVENALREKGFVRIHRSYLVNCYYIHKLNRTTVCLANGQELPVGVKYSHAVQQQFSKYLLSI